MPTTCMRLHKSGTDSKTDEVHSKYANTERHCHRPSVNNNNNKSSSNNVRVFRKLLLNGVSRADGRPDAFLEMATTLVAEKWGAAENGPSAVYSFNVAGAFSSKSSPVSVLAFDPQVVDRVPGPGSQRKRS